MRQVLQMNFYQIKGLPMLIYNCPFGMAMAAFINTG